MSELQNEILTRRDGPVSIVTINRPAKKNALNKSMYRALTQALVQAESDASVRCIVLTGSEDVFTSGNDLQDFEEQDMNSPVVPFLQLLPQIRKPMIAAVSGLAVGIGTTLLLHCDLVYVEENARFRLPFVNLGLVPEAGSSLLLPQRAGYHKAAELLLLGDFFSAKEALRAGLINAIFPRDDLLDSVIAQAKRLAEQPSRALALTKQLIKHGQQEALAARMELEGDIFSKLLQSPEAKEALAAFRESRKPDFRAIESNLATTTPPLSE